jgi:predicted Zn-dependent protease
MLNLKMMKKLLLLISLLIFPFVIDAQTKKDDKKENKTKSIKDLTKSSNKIEGLFTIYQDSINGKLKMVVSENQLEKEFIYFSQIADGVTDAGRYRGSYQNETVFYLKRYFDKIEFISPNTNFYFDPNSPLSKSKNANISDAIFYSTKILAEDKKSKHYLIDVDKMFVSETLTRIKNPRRPGSSSTRFSLGNFDREKSKVKEIKNYPENTNLKTEYVYYNPSYISRGSDAVTDARNVSIQVFHSLIEMPDDNFEVRYADPRTGFFTTETNDMTSTKTTNYRDMINKWRLVKKNPDLELSQPVKPITWWIENSTPLEWRETIKNAVLQWNIAFEKAGFIDAIEVKVQPDDAEWDAGDIRYNVLRWTSSPSPPFGGYGPSMVNPRTGEIISADIMLEFVHFTNRVFYEKLYQDPVKNMSLTDIKTGIFNNSNHVCSAGEHTHENLLYGKTVYPEYSNDDIKLGKLEEDNMIRLIMHEVGHTLGLSHNMRGSHLYSPDELTNPELIKGKAINTSVMEYPALNISLDKSKQAQFSDITVGPYDLWVIEFGYKPNLVGKERKNLLSRSNEPELAFGNDADDMRSSSRGIDPRVMIYDLSNDPIRFSIDRFKLNNMLINELKNKFLNEGSTYEDLRRGFYILNSSSSTAGNVISRFIGGVYVDRSVIGQKGSTKPYTPVSYKDQKRAMNALRNYIFSPTSFTVSSDIYNLLARERRGFDFSSGPEDPKIHSQVLGYQTRVLSHLLYPNTLQRILDSQQYGNLYSLTEFMSDLNDAMFEDDKNQNINTFRQNLQATYVSRLIQIITGSSSSRYIIPVKSMAIYNLEKIMKILKNKNGNTSTVAHKNHLRKLISNALDKV